MVTDSDAATRTGARERILDTAYGLFAHRGVQAVGVDEVIARSGVAKATLYRHFRSKDDLVLAFLEQRDRRWTHGLVETQIRERGSTPEQRLLAIFDVFDDWFRSADFEVCSFIKVLLELGPDHRLGQACIEYLNGIRELIVGLAAEGALHEPEEFARCWLILMKGSVISAAEGDRDAARRAQRMGRSLIDQHRRTDV